MSEENSGKSFVLRKINDVSFGAVGGVLGTTLWQTAETSITKGKLTAPAVKDISQKGIFTIPVAMAVTLMADLSAEQSGQRRF
jgi:hypothetical protein